MDFIQGKCQVQCLGRNNPRLPHRLGVTGGGAAVQRGIESAVHHHSEEGKQALGLQRAEQCQQVEEGNCTPLLSPADTMAGYCNSLQRKRDGDTRERVQGKANKTAGAHTALWDHTAWQRRLSMQGWRREALVYLQGGYGGDEVQLFTEGQKWNTTDIGHEMNQGGLDWI